MEVYVDNLLVKSKESEQHLDDLQEAFAVMGKYKMKHNPQKCAFEVESGKFLGFMVSEGGIEANLGKIKVIVDMPPPQTINEVQKLIGKIAALGRFIAKSTDRCRPFFKVLRNVQEWDEDCGRAFSKLKEYLAHSPLLSQTTPGEDLTVYLAVSPNAVSSVLTRGKPWQVYVDSSSFGGGVRVCIITDSGEKLDYILKLGFKATNNEAEYETLLLGLTIARSLGETEVEVKVDSQIVVGQYSTIHQIPREENQEADQLAKAASGQEEFPLLDHVVIRTIDVAAVGIRVSIIEDLQPPEWATDILKFLQGGILPEDREEARKISTERLGSLW
ncbi:hypothetical protein F2P56_032980 [Juglans regia]|uniref:Uncharacterized protein LOC109019290 n=2 Tax=Juglans regia TaxID=51240 RepID=A0A2I4HLT9_JUGRE|nr:uncharacterized protein LOC109019290 [Juglans regia]KAF5447426.1 hypothetical protein F2P56_032980 [Juglans regia]